MAQEDIDIRINTKLDAANSETDLRKLRGLLKDLQSLGEEVGDPASESFKKLAQSINEVEGKIGDASDRMKTISGEPLERVNNGFSLMSEGLSNLDFGKVKIGLDGMTEGLGKLTLKETAKGIKDVTGSFLKMGLAIATNPIFLLATTIILIIKNFDKLKAAGGAVGAMFSAIGDAIKWATDLLIKFSDAIGLTDTKAKQMAASMKSIADATQYAADKQAEFNIEMKKMQGLPTIWDEYQQKVKEVINAEKELSEVRSKGEDDVEALKKVLVAKNEVNNFYTKNKIILDKQIIENEKKIEKQRAENQKKGRTRDLAVAAVNRKEDLENVVKTNDDIIDGTVELQKVQMDIKYKNYKKDLSDKKENNDRELTIIETNLERATGVYRSKLEERRQVIMKNNQQINIDSVSADINYLKDVAKNADDRTKLYNDGLTAIGESEKKSKEILSDINKTYNDKELDELLKKNENKQRIEERQFDKESQNADLEFQEQLNLETDHYYKILSLQEENYNLQIKKSNLSEQDKLKLKLDYNQKTEDAAKKHNENLDKIFEQGANNLKAMGDALKDTGKSTSQTLEEFNRARDMELAANEQSNASQLARLQTHLEHTGGIRTKHEKELIEELSNSRSKLLENDRLKELAAAGNDLAAKSAIDKKYSNLQKQLTEETSAAKIEANVRTIDKIAAYGASAMEATELIMDLASNKDKDRLKKGEITEEQFQRREFNRKKAASIASIVMNTAEAISKAIALSPATGGAPFSIIAAALGALQFAKVTSTTFNYASPAQSTSTSSGSSGASTNRDLAAPGNPYFGQGFLNLNSFNPNMMGGVKVYVLEQDIRNAMNRATVLNNRNML